MVGDSVRFLKSKGKGVFSTPSTSSTASSADQDYALSCLRSAVNAGVDGLVLCDTNGGTLTSKLLETIEIVQRAFPNITAGHPLPQRRRRRRRQQPRGGRGTASTQVQACINGYGERCGNANMASVIANLKLKLNENVVTDAPARQPHRGLALRQRGRQHGARGRSSPTSAPAPSRTRPATTPTA